MEKEILEILVCPVCKGHLLYDPQKEELLCNFDRLAYPIRNGVPILLEKQARKLDKQER